MTAHAETERRLWELLKEHAGNETCRKVRISWLADRRLPVPHKQWTVETVRKWGNRDLVNVYQAGAVASLTPKGTRTSADQVVPVGRA